LKFPDRNLQVLVLTIVAFWTFSVGVFKASHYSADFTPIYTGARCLLAGCNPYDTAELEKQYYANGGPASQPVHWDKEPPVYPPSAFLLASPIAMLKLPAARRIWAVISAVLLITSVGCVWLTVPPFSRWIPTILGSLFMIECSNALLPLGQASTLTISLLVISATLYLRGRSIRLATLMLMLSLAIKPQMGGLIALYFVVRKIHWRGAALAMAGAVAILLVSGLLLKTRPASAHWVNDLHTNVVNSQKPGATNDPRPGNLRDTGLINVQAITSVFIASEKGYNAAAYVIFGGLLLVWMIAMAKNDADLAGHYLAIAALSVISFLPVYHRDYDTVLLLLTIPAIAVIYYRRRQWLGPAIVVTAILQALSLIQDPFEEFFKEHVEAQHLLHNRVVFVVLMRTQALEVLALAVLYTVAMFVIRDPADWDPEGSGASMNKSFAVAGKG